MRSRILRTEAPVCQLCSFISTGPSIRARPLRIPTSQKFRPFSSSQKAFATRQSTPPNSDLKPHPTSVKVSTPAQPDGSKISTPIDARVVESDLNKAASLRDDLITKDGIPSDNETEAVLDAYQKIANDLMNPHEDASSTSAILSIKTAAKPRPITRPYSPIVDGASRRLSDLALSVLQHPPIFITPSILRRYVNLQATLRRPETLPTAFHLYSTKPAPVEGSSPVKYKEVNPDKSANSIEAKLADLALQTAIENKNLGTAMDIVDTTYDTKAFRRTKFIRRALLPVTGLALAPAAAYAVATQLSLYQTTMDPTVATNVAFVGILGYIGFTTVVGVVAVTTANDQMERVTWATGMPLRERWIREEERAAIDKIAMAWGFRQIWRRGEEEGEEWEALREWVARRGMILDRTELMEGME
ncbi:hypothetical protein V495_07460 [Pseudogymnoascus sp. VKM F-4514 (FW-929)]|nr:hypothetical protein V490_03248 [Pseudogymnoascus sp. VKM F-3557]KFY37010.1 hypothetical protein V495_07460 [Pseudogymnoascus sp. VKM F-4514 (FW-929)]KFY60146.1 hypothetical protein V497_03833 [Pseudogymnoascus sp. VKM F-4516 (FW-969)]